MNENIIKVMEEEVIKKEMLIIVIKEELKKVKQEINSLNKTITALTEKATIEEVATVEGEINV